MFWGKYHEMLFDYLDLNKTYSETHTHKEIVMDSILFEGEYVKKARVTNIANGNSHFTIISFIQKQAVTCHAWEWI